MGDEAAGLTGVWILRSARLERIDTGETILHYGENPRGVLILHEGGRMAAIITPGEQSGGASWPMRKLLAYSGRYRIEAGNRFVTDVDIAWAPTWVGSSQGRNFSLAPAPSTLLAIRPRSTSSVGQWRSASCPGSARMADLREELIRSTSASTFEVHLAALLAAP